MAKDDQILARRAMQNCGQMRVRRTDVKGRFGKGRFHLTQYSGSGQES